MQRTKTDILRALEIETRIMERQRLLRRLWQLRESDPGRQELTQVSTSVGGASVPPVDVVNSVSEGSHAG